jgi:hypothetical protein
MYIHVRIHRWVLWWFYVGAVCGVVALVNILVRDLSRTQEKIVLVIGLCFWLLGGLVCYGGSSVQIDNRSQQSAHDGAPRLHRFKEGHFILGFVLPGHRMRLRSPKHQHG